MGEIADALRRFGLDPRSPGRKPALPSELPVYPVPDALPESEAREDLQAQPRSLPRREQVLRALSPGNPAIVTRDGPEAEVCRQLAVRLRARLQEVGADSVAIVSAMPQEGKTTVLCDLGLALASLSNGRDVAIVDLDLRNPSVSNALKLDAECGVEEALRGGATLDDVRISLERPALDVYPAVTPQDSAHELLVLPQFARLIAELEERYAIVMVDTPPALLVPDANLVLHHVDVCLPIARAGRTRARSFRSLIETLPRRQVLAQLLNDSSSAPSHGYYGYYGAAKQGEGAPGSRTSAPAGERK